MNDAQKLICDLGGNSLCDFCALVFSWVGRGQVLLSAKFAEEMHAEDAEIETGQVDVMLAIVPRPLRYSLGVICALVFSWIGRRQGPLIAAFAE